jgi:hypothetical protein
LCSISLANASLLRMNSAMVALTPSWPTLRAKPGPAPEAQVPQDRVPARPARRSSRRERPAGNRQERPTSSPGVPDTSTLMCCCVARRSRWRPVRPILQRSPHGPVAQTTLASSLQPTHRSAQPFT